MESLVALAKDFAVSKEAMARAWVDEHREPVAVIVAQNGQILRFYRSEDFPWLTARNGERLLEGSIAEQHSASPGVYSDIEEVDPDIWLGDRDASRTILLTEQVFSQQNGYALILLQAELDED